MGFLELIIAGYSKKTAIVLADLDSDLLQGDTFHINQTTVFGDLDGKTKGISSFLCVLELPFDLLF